MTSYLITGGTGFLGTALTKRLLDTGTAERVCVLSRNEHAQADMRETFDNDQRLRTFVGDVRDLGRIRRAMDGIDIVIHAAALKRVEVGFYDPEEMTKTNVIGTLNVIEAARQALVSKVVFVSSDKAFEAKSSYGQSKALAEANILAANYNSGAKGPKFSVVRYGNVFSSTGSVVPKWRAMVATGKRPHMTSPDCTRFFMRVDQAVDLVLNTAATMKGDELAIPDLPAFRLGDLAEAMEIDPIITGLPDWEKAHESMGPGNSSDQARRMSVAELRSELGMLPALKVAA